MLMHAVATIVRMGKLLHYEHAPKRLLFSQLPVRRRVSTSIFLLSAVLNHQLNARYFILPSPWKNP